MEKIELHPALKREGRKTLRDIYYSRDKINKWRDKCLRKQDDISTKLDNYMNSILLIKEKVKEIRNEFLISNKDSIFSFIKQIRTAHDKAMQSSEIILNRNYLAYSAHRKNLEKFAREEFFSREEGVTALFDSQKALETVLNNQEKEKQAFEEQCTKITNFYRQLKWERARLETDYFRLLKEVFNKTGSLDSLSKKLDNLVEVDCKKINEEFEFLKKPLLMKDAYEKSLIEISRRKWFFEQYYDIYKELKKNFSSENALRINFQNCYGDILPITFVPELKNTLPDLSNSSGFDMDRGLPNIQNLHRENDIKLTKKPGLDQTQDSILSQLKNEAERFSLKLKKSELKISKLLTEKTKLTESLSTANERLTNNKFIERKARELDYSEFNTICCNTTLAEDRVKNLIKAILGNQARSLYEYFSPMIISKNQEIADEKIRNLQMKTEYEALVEKKEEEFKNKISEFHRDVEQMHLRLRNQNNLNGEQQKQMELLKGAVQQEKNQLLVALKEKEDQIKQLRVKLSFSRKK